MASLFINEYEKEFWIDNFDKGYYDKIILKGLALKEAFNLIGTIVHTNMLSKKFQLMICILIMLWFRNIYGRYLYSNSIGVDISDSQIEYARQTFQKDKFFKFRV